MASSIAPRAYSIPSLNASNYASWSIKIEMLLIRSELWSVVDGSEPSPPSSNVADLTVWQLKDSKARSDILLHCGEKQLISLRPLKTSKDVWERIKQLYERSNKASQVYLHKQLCHMTMSESDDVISFLETWQSTLQEAAISGCTFSDAQQVNLLLSALPDSWGPFITTQGAITDLNFTTLLSNILQQNSINQSKIPEPTKTSAFYVKGKFTKPFNSKPGRFSRPPSYRPPYNHNNNNLSSNKYFSKPSTSHSPIICHYCGIPGHKAPDCRKKKRDLGAPSRDRPRSLSNNFVQDAPLHLFSAITSGTSINSPLWYLDSGASQHMTPCKSFLQDYQELPTSRTIILGDDYSHSAEGFGSALIQIKSGQTLLIKDILYVPGLARNLISIAQITLGPTVIIFKQDHCILKIQIPSSKITTRISIPKQDNLYPLGTCVQPTSSNFTATLLPRTKTELETLRWHYRLGHLNFRFLNLMHTSNLVIGLPPLKSNMTFCEGCIYGKHSKSNVNIEPATRATQVLALIHSDLCGPMSMKSLGGALYFLLFIDDYSRYTHIYFLKKKSETFSYFQSYKTLVENQTSQQILILRSDNGGEFISKDFNKFCIDHGIHRHFTNPYTPSQNGVSERKNRTLMEAARSMLRIASLSHSFWAEATATACYLQNISYTKSLNNTTPYQLWTGLCPNLSNLRIFGCHAYVHIPDSKRQKLDNKTIKCIFIGYAEQSGVKGYKLYDINTHRVFFSRDVIFNEDKLLQSNSSNEVPSTRSTLDYPSNDFYMVSDPPDLPTVNIEPDPQQDLASQTSQSLDLTPDSPKPIPQSSPIISTPNHQLSSSSGQTSLTSDSILSMSPHLRSHYRQSPHSTPPRTSQRPNRGKWRSTKFHDENLFSYAFIAHISEPSSVQEALTSPEAPQWKKAMDSEYQSLIDNHTWELVELPHNKNIISTKWIFRRKYKSDGSISRFKARFVARGFSQEEGIDYSETFSPVLKMTSLRLLLALATLYDYHIHQMDVVTAFLNGTLREDIYISQPDGYIQPGKEHQVCKLLKSLYGLKQAPRIWYELFDNFLLSQGFSRCESDTNVYVKRSQSTILLLGLYIDDLLLICNNLQYLTATKALFSHRFAMTDNNEIEYILNIQIRRNRSQKTLTLSQDKYIFDLLTKFNMVASNPVATPLEAGIRYSRHQSDDLSPDQLELMKTIPYQQAIGSLQYLVTCTRWDLAFPISHLAQFMSNPAPVHWLGVKRIFRYLRGTSKQGLTYTAALSPHSTLHQLRGWSDADWAGDPDTRKSTSGYIFQLDSSSILSWQSRKQSIVALSSTEAEYIAAATATKELIWLQTIISELGYTLSQPSIIYSDNQSSIALSANPKHHERSKHIDIRFHFLREKVSNKILKLEYTPTARMWADILTKSLPKDKHYACLQGLNSSPISDLEQGGVP